MTLKPLPFRLNPTGRDSVDLDGIASVSHVLTGRLLAGAWVLGGWWMPRFDLRVRSVEDPEGVPATRGVALALHR